MRYLTSPLLVLFAFTISVSAQQGTVKNDENVKSNAVETAVAKLQQKVLLSDEQAEKVKDIISSNLKELQNDGTKKKALNNSQTRVEQLLDEKQKAKYSIIKEDWWDNLVKNI